MLTENEFKVLALGIRETNDILKLEPLKEEDFVVSVYTKIQMEMARRIVELERKLGNLDGKAPQNLQ